MLFDKLVQLNLQDRSLLYAKSIYYNFTSVDIYIIGCGGTGSFLVPHLCRIANFLRGRGRRINLVLVDYDRIEERNLYRQNFCHGELGWNKAEALAMRYKTLYPQLKISALAEDAQYLSVYSNVPTVIVGCTDNAEARSYILQLMRWKQPNSHCWWVDCGNDYSFGQVAIGNSNSIKLEKYKLEPATCKVLPLPILQYPQLLEEDEKEEELESLSCADRAMLNGQSLNINCHIAAVAAEMVNQLLQNQLKRINVELDIFRGSMRSTFITQENIDRLVTRAGEVLGEVE